MVLDNCTVLSHSRTNGFPLEACKAIRGLALGRGRGALKHSTSMVCMGVRYELYGEEWELYGEEWELYGGSPDIMCSPWLWEFPLFV